MSRSQGRTADHQVMRALNRQTVLDALQRSGPMSRADLARATELTKPTVAAIVDDLSGEGLVRVVGPGATGAEGGRPSTLLAFDATAYGFVGIHVGVRRTTVAVADALGAIVHRAVHDTSRAGAERDLDRIVGHVEAAVADGPVPTDRIRAIGVCLPGLVDGGRGRCLLAPNLGWHDVPVADHLGARLARPVLVRNTAQACAVAEAAEGAAVGIDEVVLLYAGTGVGAGVVSHGRLLRGAAGLTGEIGHCVLPGATGRCGCGKRGCVETVAATPAVLRALRPARRRGVRGAEPSPPTLEDVLAAAAAGDREARAVLAAAGRSLGVAASWLVNLLNPQVLVLAGALGAAGPVVQDALEEALADHALADERAALAVVPWALGHDAKVRGAVLVARTELDDASRLLFDG